MKKEKQVRQNRSKSLPVSQGITTSMQVSAPQLPGLDVPIIFSGLMASAQTKKGKISIPISSAQPPHNQILDSNVLKMGADWGIEKRLGMAKLLSRWGSQLRRSAEILTRLSN